MFSKETKRNLTTERQKTEQWELPNKDKTKPPHFESIQLETCLTDIFKLWWFQQNISVTYLIILVSRSRCHDDELWEKLVLQMAPSPNDYQIKAVKQIIFTLKSTFLEGISSPHVQTNGKKSHSGPLLVLLCLFHIVALLVPSFAVF